MTYKGPQTFGEVFVVGQLVEGAGPVFIYEERHGVVRFLMVESGGSVEDILRRQTRLIATA